MRIKSQRYICRTLPCGCAPVHIRRFPQSTAVDDGVIGATGTVHWAYATPLEVVGTARTLGFMLTITAQSWMENHMHTIQVAS